MTRRINPIYSGKRKDFHWIGFGSGRGTNICACARVIKPTLVFSDRPKAKMLNLEDLADVPRIVIDGYEACGSWKKAKGNKNLEDEYLKRSLDYDYQVMSSIKEFEKTQGVTIDLIVLGGYMRLVQKPMLDAYKDRIINVHPADLSILDKNNARKYTGDDAVEKCIRAREKSTKSSVIIVDGGVDHGEILVQGPTLENNYYLHKAVTVKGYAAEQQLAQKRISDWPALTTALEMIAGGRLALGTEKEFFNEWRRVYLDGSPLGYEGYQLSEAKK